MSEGTTGPHPPDFPPVTRNYHGDSPSDRRRGDDGRSHFGYAVFRRPRRRPGGRAGVDHPRATAHRRDRLRLRRRRPEVRPDLRPGVRQDGQRRLDRRDHPGRDPAAAAHATAARQGIRDPASAPTRSPTGATRPTWSSRSTSRCCSPGTGSARWRDDAIILIENMWEHARRRRHPARVGGGDGGAGRPWLPVSCGSRWRSSASRSSTTPRRGKNMFALGLLAWIYDRDLAKIRDVIAHEFRKKSQEVVRGERRAARPRLAVGRGEPRLPDRGADRGAGRAAWS